MNDAAEWIVLAGAVFAVVVTGVRYLWKGFRMAESIHRLVEHELQPNSGSSLYDMVKRLDQGFTQHLADSASDSELLHEMAGFMEKNHGFERRNKAS